MNVLGKDLLAVTRYIKNSYSRWLRRRTVNRQMIRFEKGTDTKVFIRAIALVNMSSDTTVPMYKAVRNSNVDPIAASFDIKSIKKIRASSSMSPILSAEMRKSLVLTQTLKPSIDSAAYKMTNHIFNLSDLILSISKSKRSKHILYHLRRMDPFPGVPQSVTYQVVLYPDSATIEMNTSIIKLPDSLMRKDYLIQGWDILVPVILSMMRKANELKTWHLLFVGGSNQK